MQLSVNYTHTSGQIRYFMVSNTNQIIVDSILSSGPQTITIPANTSAGTYTLYVSDPKDAAYQVVESVVVPICTSPSATPSVTPSITPSITVSPSVAASPSVTPTPTVTPSITPSPSPVFSTYVTITAYTQPMTLGTIDSINIYNSGNVLVLSKNKSSLSIGENTFLITPYSGPYRVEVSGVYKDTARQNPEYIAISSTNGFPLQTSNFGSLTVTGYGTRNASNQTTIGITLGGA